MMPLLDPENLAARSGRSSQPVEENAGDDADYENQKKRHDRVGEAHEDSA
jgi:hypothetical protein